jgi:hypothetical protein
MPPITQLLITRSGKEKLHRQSSAAKSSGSEAAVLLNGLLIYGI